MESISSMKDKEHTQFGPYEKRDKLLDLYCTPKEKEAWQKHWGRRLASVIREGLSVLLLEQKQVSRPSRPPLSQTTARVNFLCTDSELWAWRMVVPGYGSRSRLGQVVCEMLNQKLQEDNKS